MPPRPPGLTPKQQRFVEEYLVDLNGAAAAIRAGYSAKTANVGACQLLSYPLIAEAVAAAKAKRSEETGIIAARVLQEFARIGFADIRHVMQWSETEVRFTPSADLTEEQAAAIAGVEAEIGTDGRAKLKLKLSDKVTALTQIGRHLGMFKDKVEHSGDQLNVVVTYEQRAAGDSDE